MMQNRILKKHAFLNAHHVRGPLARVMGLVYLLKLQKFNLEEVDLLDEAANELDSEINSVQKNLDFHTKVSANKKGGNKKRFEEKLKRKINQ